MVCACSRVSTLVSRASTRAAESYRRVVDWGQAKFEAHKKNLVGVDLSQGFSRNIWKALLRGGLTGFNVSA